MEAAEVAATVVAVAVEAVATEVATAMAEEVDMEVEGEEGDMVVVATQVRVLTTSLSGCSTTQFTFANSSFIRRWRLRRRPWWRS